MSDELKLKIILDDGSVKEGFLKLEKTADDSSKKIGKALDANSVEEFKNSLEDAARKFGPMIAAAALVGVTVKKAFDLVLEGEALAKIEKQFSSLSTSVGIDGNKLKAAFIDSLDGIVDDSDAIESLNKALVSLGSRAEQLPQIMELARKATKAFGGEVVERFETINQAISSGATRQLRAIGININAEKAYKEYAKSIGVSVDVLSEAGKQQAILNRVLEEGEKKFAGISGAASGATGANKRLNVTIQNIEESFAIFVSKNYGEFFESMLNKIDVGLKKLTGNFGPKDALNELGSEIEETQIRLNQLKFAKFERENTKGVIDFFKAISDNEGPLSTVNKNLGETEKKLANLREQFASLSPKPTDKPGNPDTTSKDDATNAEESLKKRQKIELELTQFIFAQQQLRAQSQIQQNALALANDLDAKTKLSLVDENFNIQSKLSEDQLARDIAALKDKYKDTPEAKAALNNQILMLDLTHKQAMLLQEQQYQEQSKSYREQAAFDSLTAFQQVGVGFETIFQGAENAAKKFTQNSVAGFKQVGAQAVSTFSLGIGNAFNKFGAALKNGEDAGQAFASAVGDSIVSVASQFGDFFIQTGIGKLAVSYGADATGYTMIAAGAALKILAGAAGAKSSAGAGDSGGGGIAAAPSLVTDNQPTQNLEREKASTQVSVVIQGDVLDSDESGSRIVNLINTAFDKKGVVIQQGAFA